MNSQTIRTYYLLTKPGIIYGNAITAVAGFFLASRGHVNAVLFFAMLVGLSLVIGSACVFNNYLDRNIDKKMERTKNRALAANKISVKHAIIFATVLIIAGILLLGLFTNLLTLIIALIGFFDYVVLYGYYKRASIHGTVVGSVSGAIPIVVGYTSVANRIDLGAVILFAILVAWQMPHFYAIAIYRLKDYSNAGIPVLPAKKGILHTKMQIFLYVVAFVIATLLLSAVKLTGYTYTFIAIVFGLIWLGMSIQGFFTKDNIKWAKKTFMFSLIIILVFSISLSINAFVK